MKKLFFMLTAFLAVATFVVPAQAVQTDFSITICHHTPGNDVTHTFSNLQSYQGHLGIPHSGSTYDTSGACSTPAPSEEPSSTPLPTIDPCLEATEFKLEFESPCETPTPSASESATPSPSATPGTSEDKHDQPQANGGTSEAPHVECSVIKETPTIWEVSRNNPTSIHAKWSPVDPFVTHYKIEYGLANGVVLWNTIVEGTETNLNFLPFNHILWLRVAGTDNGCVGNYSSWIDP